jgi:hypothetical protein
MVFRHCHPVADAAQGLPAQLRLVICVTAALRYHLAVEVVLTLVNTGIVNVWEPVGGAAATASCGRSVRVK